MGKKGVLWKGALWFLAAAAVVILTACAPRSAGSNTAALDPMWTDEARVGNLHVDAGVDCFQCHLEGDDQQPLKKVAKETCLGCHGLSYENLMAQTEALEPNPHDAPHYDKMACNLCHSVHGDSEMMCSECHTFTYFEALKKDGWIIEE